MKFGLIKKKGFQRGGFLLGAVAALVSTVLAMQSPLEVYASIDPGLDSGNATVDRTSVPGQTILKYTTAGNSTFKAPAGVTDVRVMTVGGGGGGGAGESTNAGDAGGGGGSGEYVHETSFSVTPGAPVSITVGGGGAGSTTKQADGGTTAQNGVSGSNSVFGTLTARGGGGGGGNDQHGVAGGSGGGAGGHCTNSGTNTNGGASTAVAPGVGNAGGISSSGSCNPRGAAGGGGAGAVGTGGSGSAGGVGAIGLQNDITGANVFYAAGGGGGGGKDSGAGANGGSSIGGKGGNASGGSGTVGTANTGSGGGGGGSSTSTGGGNGGNGGSGIVVVRFTTQTFPDPGGVAGAVMWYKADSAGNTSAQWNDVSGFGVNLAQADAGKQPALTTNALNFNPAYVFDGTDDVFNFTNTAIGASDSISAFYAATSTNAAGGDRYFNEFGDDHPSITMYNGKPRLYVRDTSSVDDVFGTEEALQPHVYSFVSPNGGGSKVISVDNREQTKSISGSYVASGGSSNNTLGGKNVSAGTSWVGPIAEAIYFNRQLNAVERQKVNSYLAIKYGVTLGSGTIATDYFDSGSATVWTADNTYKNNIAGIGRDDTSTLNQKQSKSTSDGSLVAIGHGDILASNQANANNFANDKTFMLWGHDSGVTDQATAVSGTGLMRMGRVWKAVVTNTVGPVKVQIPTSIITRSTATLLVSNSATFDGSSQQVPMSVNGSNYEATTTLAPGTHYFTFASEAGADIEFVSKTATDTSNTAITSYTPGQPLEYHLTVKNNGPDDAGLITVSDTLPADIVPTVNGSSGDGWNCSVSVPTVSCTRSSLAAGATAPEIIIEATVASSVTGQKVNTATASEASDPDTSNNSASVTLDSAPVADLSIAKEDTTPGNPVSGNEYDYKFVVTNSGPSDVASYTINDTLPSGITYVSDFPANSCPGSSGQTVTCTGGALASGASGEITIKVLVGTTADYTNTATVSVPAGTTDPVSGNNTSTNTTNVDIQTDLTVSKSHTGDFTAGDNNTFTINVTNNGPSEAPTGSITITDTLDEDFTLVTADGGASWGCNGPPATTVTCTYNAALASGATTPDITVTVLVDSIAKGATTNTATVSSTSPDPTPGNNSSTDNITIVAEADLAITKNHVGTEFTAGKTGQYTFSVTNNGPSADTPKYTISDTLPTGLTYAGIWSGDATDCSSPDNITVTCTGGGLFAGDPAQVTTITVNVDPGATGSINNSATVAPDPTVTDPISGNNTSPDTVNIEPNADLSIVKTPPATMTAGDTVNYTLTVTNNGPSDVSSFTVSDTLDSNLTFDSTGSDSGCSASGQDVTCTGGILTSGNNVDITVSVTVAPTATNGATITNTADVAVPADVNDPNSANNSSTINNTIETSADLSVTKSHTGNFTVGANGTFTITATNNGTSDASTATVVDVLPDGLTYVSATSVPAGAADCDNSGQTVNCFIGPTFANGESVDITLTVSVDADVTVTSIENTATIASATPDPISGNNSSPDTVSIDPATADLTATKTAQGSLTAGSPVTYRFEVTNDGGPDNAGIVTITDTLPAYLTFQSFNSVSGGMWNCVQSDPGVTCTLPVLNVGDTSIVDVTLLVAQDAPTPAENSATVTFNGTDPTPVNLSTSSPVSYSADLEVQLTHDFEKYESGETVTFTYTVINHGPSTAEDVVLTDTLPNGLTFQDIVATNIETDDRSVLAKAVDTALGTATVSAAPNTPFTCNNSGQDVTCNASALNVGTYTITMTALISNSFTGDLTSVAQITSSTPDPNSANNTSSDTIVGVTSPSGLAGTGYNIVIVLAASVALLGGATALIVWKRHRTVPVNAE